MSHNHFHPTHNRSPEIARSTEISHPNHGWAISQSHRDGGGGVGGPVGIGDEVTVAVAACPSGVGVEVEWSPAVEVALGEDVSVGVFVLDSVGEALGVADLTGESVTVGVLVFVAAGSDVDVAEAAGGAVAAEVFVDVAV